MKTKLWLIVSVLVCGGFGVSAAMAATPIYAEDFNVMPTGWWINLPTAGDTGSTSSPGNGNPDGTPCLHLARGTDPGALEMLATDLRHEWATPSTWIAVNDFGFTWSYQAQVIRNGAGSAAYPDLIVYIQYADLTYAAYELTPGPYYPDNGTWTTLTGTVNDPKKIAWIYSVQFGGEAMRINDVVNADNIVLNPLPVVVQGTVVPLNYTGDNTTVGVQVEFLQDGVVIATEHRFLDVDGKFLINSATDNTSVTAGTYDVAVKTFAHLRKIKTGVTVGTATDLGTIDLIGGDCDGDNTITSTDLSIVLLNMDLIGE